MKKMALLVPILVVLMLFSVAPAMACTSVPASVLTTAYAPPAPTPGTTYTINGFTIVVGATVNVFATMTIGATAYPIYSVNTYWTITDPSGNSYTHYDAIWYVESSSSGVALTANGFRGSVDVFTTASWVNIQAVLQGFGSFHGQTLMVSYSGAPGLAEYYWTGNVLMH